MDVYCVVLYWNGTQRNAMLYACTYVHLYVYICICIYIYLHMCNISIIFIQIMSFFSTHMHAYISHTQIEWRIGKIN